MVTLGRESMVVYPCGTYIQLYAGWGVRMVRADIIPPSPWGHYFYLIDIAILYFAIFAFFCEYSNIVFILNTPAGTIVLFAFNNSKTIDKFIN